MEEEVAARMEEEPDLVLHDHIFLFPLFDGVFTGGRTLGFSLSSLLPFGKRNKSIHLVKGVLMVLCSQRIQSAYTGIAPSL